MPRSARLFLALGAIAMLAPVALSAFGAHALKSELAPDTLAIYRTGAKYHFYHALGLLAVGLVAFRLPESKLLRAAGWLMAAGIVMFSGSLYLLALTGVHALAIVTPIGGLAFVFAWIEFALAILKATRT